MNKSVKQILGEKSFASLKKTMFSNNEQEQQKKKQANKERFEQWMRNCGNVFLGDNERMCNAYERLN